MSMVENLQLWHDAVTEYSKKNYNEALMKLLSMTDVSAKILFNIGCVHLAMDQNELAVKAFIDVIQKDGHFVLAHFMLGQIHLQLKNYKQALRAFEETLSKMRGKGLIDYKQLGLKHKLMAYQIMINQAVCHVNMGSESEARDKLLKALHTSTQTKVLTAIQSLQGGKPIKPVKFPSNLLFKPSKAKIENLPKRDYLGKAKVVVSADNDFTTGFAGASQDQGQQPQPAQQATEGEVFVAIYEFQSSNPQELPLSEGDEVLVTEKGEDGWFTVTHSKTNKVGLVPGLYLEKKVEDAVEEIPAEPSGYDALLNDIRRDDSRRSLKRGPRPKPFKLPNLPQGMKFGSGKTEDSPEPSRPPPPTTAPPRRASKSVATAEVKTTPPTSKRQSIPPEVPERPAILKKIASQEKANIDLTVNVVRKVPVNIQNRESYQKLLSTVARSAGSSASKVSLWYECNNRQNRIDEINYKSVLQGLQKGTCTLWCYDDCGD